MRTYQITKKEIEGLEVLAGYANFSEKFLLLIWKIIRVVIISNFFNNSIIV